MILASLEIYSLWLYGHSKQHCRSSQVLSLVHSVVYILVELIIYYVSLNILFKRFLPEKVCIVLRELFHEETNSSCWWYIRWHSPVLWCWQQIYIIRILLFCLLSSRRQYTDLSYLSCKHYTTRFYHGDIIFLIANQEVRTYWLVVVNRFSLFLNMAPESNLYYSACIVFTIPH